MAKADGTEESRNRATRAFKVQLASAPGIDDSTSAFAGHSAAPAPGRAVTFGRRPSDGTGGTADDESGGEPSPVPSEHVGVRMSGDPSKSRSRCCRGRCCACPLEWGSAPFRFIMLSLSVTAMISGYLSYEMPAITSADLKQSMGINNRQLGLLFSVYAFPNAFMPLFSGVYFSKVGTWRGVLVLSAIITVGVILTSIGVGIDSLWALLIGRAVYGFGGESIYVGIDVLATGWFREAELGLAYGIIQAAGQAGSTAAFFGVPPLADAIGDFRVVYYISAGISCCAFLALCLAKWLEDTSVWYDDEDEDVSKGEVMMRQDAGTGQDRRGEMDDDVADDGGGNDLANGGETGSHDYSITSPSTRSRKSRTAAAGPRPGRSAALMRHDGEDDLPTSEVGTDHMDDGDDDGSSSDDDTPRHRHRTLISRLASTRLGALLGFDHLAGLNADFWLLFVAIVAYSAVFYTFLDFGNDWLQVEHGLQPTQSGRIVGLISILSCVISPTSGLLLDKFGGRPIASFLSMATACAAFSFLAYSTLPVEPLIMVAGVAYSILPSSLYPMVAEVVPDESFTVVYAAINAGVNFVLMAAFYVAGWISQPGNGDDASGGNMGPDVGLTNPDHPANQAETLQALWTDNVMPVVATPGAHGAAVVADSPKTDYGPVFTGFVIMTGIGTLATGLLLRQRFRERSFCRPGTAEAETATEPADEHDDEAAAEDAEVDMQEAEDAALMTGAIASRSRHRAPGDSSTSPRFAPILQFKPRRIPSQHALDVAVAFSGYQQVTPSTAAAGERTRRGSQGPASGNLPRGVADGGAAVGLPGRSPSLQTAANAAAGTAASVARSSQAATGAAGGKQRGRQALRARAVPIPESALAAYPSADIAYRHTPAYQAMHLGAGTHAPMPGQGGHRARSVGPVVAGAREAPLQDVSGPPTAYGEWMPSPELQHRTRFGSLPAESRWYMARGPGDGAAQFPPSSAAALHGPVFVRNDGRVFSTLGLAQRMGHNVPLQVMDARRRGGFYRPTLGNVYPFDVANLDQSTSRMLNRAAHTQGAHGMHAVPGGAGGHRLGHTGSGDAAAAPATAAQQQQAAAEQLLSRSYAGPFFLEQLEQQQRQRRQHRGPAVPQRRDAKPGAGAASGSAVPGIPASTSATTTGSRAPPTRVSDIRAAASRAAANANAAQQLNARPTSVAAAASSGRDQRVLRVRVASDEDRGYESGYAALPSRSPPLGSAAPQASAPQQQPAASGLLSDLARRFAVPSSRGQQRLASSTSRSPQSSVPPGERRLRAPPVFASDERLVDVTEAAVPTSPAAASEASRQQVRMAPESLSSTAYPIGAAGAVTSVSGQGVGRARVVDGPAGESGHDASNPFPMPPPVMRSISRGLSAESPSDQLGTAFDARGYAAHRAPQVAGSLHDRRFSDGVILDIQAATPRPPPADDDASQ